MLLLPNLQLFDGEGDNKTGNNTSVAGQQTEGDGAEPVVILGKLPPEMASLESDKSNEGDDNQETKRLTEFNALKEKFPDLYQAEVDRIFNKRFGDTKAKDERLSMLESKLGVLGKYYGSEDDIDAAIARMEDELTEQEADEAGMTPEQYKEYKELKNYKEAKTKEETERDRTDNDQKLVNGWFAEGEKVKETYKEFDLKKEAHNDEFVAMLTAGVSVKKAYEVMHPEVIAQKVKENVVTGIKSGTQRIPELGVNKPAGVIVKSDPSKWTKEERDEVRKKVARGEKIYL